LGGSAKLNYEDRANDRGWTDARKKIRRGTEKTEGAGGARLQLNQTRVKSRPRDAQGAEPTRRQGLTFHGGNN